MVGLLLLRACPVLLRLTLLIPQVAVDPQSGRPLKGALRPVHLPSGPISEMAELAGKRKEDRLLDKRVLQR